MDGIPSFCQALYESMGTVTDRVIAAKESVAQGLAEIFDHMIRKEEYVYYYCYYCYFYFDIVILMK